MSYYIINPFTLKETEVKDNWLFSNPIKKLGSQNCLMAYEDIFGGYQANFSHAMKKHYIIKFYEYGEHQPFNVKGWLFPKEVKGLVYSSSSGNTHNEFSFECYSPTDLKYYVNVHITEPFLWGCFRNI